MGKLLDELGWALKRECDSINDVRKEFGLDPISYREVPCKRLKQATIYQYSVCGKPFEAQFSGHRRVEHFCPKCRYDLAEIDRSTI